MSRPPAATPSPNRFLPGNQRKQQSPPGTSKRPPSTLRKQVVAHPTEPESLQGGPTQFAPTPRFAPGKPKIATRGERAPSPPRSTLAQALRAIIRQNEQVDDPSGFQYGDDDEMLDSGQVHGQPSIEGESSTFEGHPLWTNDLALSPKRRRLDDNEPFQTVSDLTFQSPQIPGSLLRNQMPLFTSSHGQPTSQSSTAPDPGHPQRPSFIRPPQQTQEPIEPLPETFSPHRRGQKFIPGGMAATVQQWVLETGQAAVQSRRGQGYLRGEDYVMRVKIESDVTGTSPFLVHGRTADDARVDLLLAGKSEVGGISTAQKVCAGYVLGIRAPTWDLELDGKTWTVGVDWRVFS